MRMIIQLLILLFIAAYFLSHYSLWIFGPNVLEKLDFWMKLYPRGPLHTKCVNEHCNDADGDKLIYAVSNFSFNLNNLFQIAMGFHKCIVSVSVRMNSGERDYDVLSTGGIFCCRPNISLLLWSAVSNPVLLHIYPQLHFWQNK